MRAENDGSSAGPTLISENPLVWRSGNGLPARKRERVLGRAATDKCQSSHLRSALLRTGSRLSLALTACPVLVIVEPKRNWMRSSRPLTEDI
jgi:hypothetical protein